MSKRASQQKIRDRRGRRRSKDRLVVGIVIVGIVAAAVIVVSVLILIGNASDNSAPLNYQGLTQQIDRTGAVGIAIGKPDAPVTVIEYADFSCVHCHDLAKTMHTLINTYVRNGKLRVIYKPITILDPTYSTMAARGLICGAEQGKGWEMHDQIWGIYDSNSPYAYTEGVLTTRAGAIGLDTDSFRTCLNSGETNAAIKGLDDERQALGVNQTPTVLLNGRPVDPGQLSSEVQAAAGG